MPVQSQYAEEQSVAELMLKDFAAGLPAASLPSFFFHLGDVVYYYGEQEYYYDQFYHPYLKILSATHPRDSRQS